MGSIGVGHVNEGPPAGCAMVAKMGSSMPVSLCFRFRFFEGLVEGLADAVLGGAGPAASASDGAILGAAFDCARRADAASR
jgi:hypothetical protein